MNEAFTFITVARIVCYALQSKLIWRMKVTRMTTTFVWLDVVASIVQGTGKSIMSQMIALQDDPILRARQQVYIAGANLQLAFIAVFGVAISNFFCRT